MTLSLSEALLASACTDSASMAEMAPDGHDATPHPTGDHESTQDGDQRSDCPMSAATVSNCVASAILARVSTGMAPAAVTAERGAPDSPHIPGSYHASALFRPPIA